MALTPELLATWVPDDETGPNERRVLEEFQRLPPEVAEAELADWLMARLGAILKDASIPYDYSRVQNPS